VSPDELLLEIDQAVSHASGPLSHVMVNVAGRWTNIQGLSWDEETGTLFIDTED
jgi:hypothetical protein